MFPAGGALVTTAVAGLVCWGSNLTIPQAEIRIFFFSSFFLLKHKVSRLNDHDQ